MHSVGYSTLFMYVCGSLSLISVSLTMHNKAVILTGSRVHLQTLIFV